MISDAHKGATYELKNVAPSTETVTTRSALYARGEVTLSVMTITFAPFCRAISKRLKAIVEYRGKLKSKRQSLGPISTNCSIARLESSVQLTMLGIK